MSSGGEIRGVVIDDDSTFLRSIKSLVTQNLKEIEWQFFESFEDGCKFLKSSNVDIVLTDYYEDSKDSGKAVVETIREHLSCPIFVISGQPKVEELVTSYFVKYIDKQDVTNVVSEVKGLFNVISAFRNVKHMQAKNLSEYFFNFLDEKFSELGTLDKDEIQFICRKRVALELDVIADNEVREKINPVEIYIYPPVGNILSLGDILVDSSSSEIFVILTPRCSLARATDEKKILIAGTVKASEHLGEKTIDSEKKILAAIRSDNKKPKNSKYFLPKVLDIESLFVDFESIQTITKSEVSLYSANEDNKKFFRKASLCSPFSDELQKVFLSFVGALGTPDFDPDKLLYLKNN